MERTVADGPFGQDVVARIEELLNSTSRDRSDAVDVTTDHGAVPMTVAVASTINDTWIRALEAKAMAKGELVVPVTLEFPVVRVGPVVGAGRRPCWSCFIDRLYQHDRQGAKSAERRRASSSHVRVSATTHAGYHAAATAGLAHTVLARPELWGRVITYDLVRNEVAGAPVVPWHGCGTCGVALSTRARRLDDVSRWLSAPSPSRPVTGGWS